MDLKDNKYGHDGDNRDDAFDFGSPSPKLSTFYIGAEQVQVFTELQELVPRVQGGLHFTEDVFDSPVTAHLRVLWLEVARWVDFEQDYNKIGQRFTEPHVSPMKFSRVSQLCEQLNAYGKIIRTDATTLGSTLNEISAHARESGCVRSKQEFDVLRAILLAERWHPEVKGCISDMEEFAQYWENSVISGVNPAYENESTQGDLGGQSNNELETFQSSYNKLVNLQDRAHHPYHRYNNLLTSTLGPGSEACTAMCGTIEFLEKPLIVLVRLNNCIRKSCITEVDIPVRFIFVYLGPPSTELRYDKLARVFAVMMGNVHFRACINEAKDVRDIVDAINGFMNDALVMPISRFTNPETLAGMVRQIEAYKREVEHDVENECRLRNILTSGKPSQVDLPYNFNFAVSRKLSAISLALNDAVLRTPAAVHQSLSKPTASSRRKQFIDGFCPPFVDFFRGLKPWANRVPSDYRDAFKKDHLSIVFGSVLFLYFVNLAPAITFGALLNTQVDPSFTISLTLLSTGVFITVFTLLAGQPLAFVGLTAPMFILETAIASVAKDAHIDAKLLRFWAAIYCSMFGIFFLGCNASVLANHIRRSVEEIFNSFIAFFFLLKSLFTMFRLIPSGPKNSSPDANLDFSNKLAIAGATLFLAFIKLQFCLSLARIKRGNYFRRIIRKMLGALNVPLGMLLITALDLIFFQKFNLPKVSIPPPNRANVSSWFNMPNMKHLLDYGPASPFLVHGMAISIGLTMGIIIFTEVALNGITAMKNKAVKPNVFVMDVLLMQIIFPVVSGVLGWPFCSGATVRTMSNLVALVKMDHAPAPGIPHRVIGTVEQRVSGLLVGVFVALSIFLGSILSFIPLAALYGMFLYMGVMGLRDLQFFLRVLALLKRRKHWEDWECVRGLPGKHILVFAIIQTIIIAILVALNIVAEFSTAKYAGIIFPVIILLYALFRESALPRWTWLSLYLHQLDRKYKLNPVTHTAVIEKSCSRKETLASLHVVPSVVNNDSHGNTVLLSDVECEEELSDHEDGVVRRTWAT
ncbi:unnamed protein product [Calicophoron daubneyi]|uniref:Anion exchange protein n=1 Tax=Calicophoron daubneyi TaxID=300641 RepID=A0AAV2U0S5_CALDB